MRPLRGLFSLTRGSAQSPLDLRDTAENGQIMRMLGNDHFQSSWWGNYSVSSFVFSLGLVFWIFFFFLLCAYLRARRREPLVRPEPVT